jgi:hypothetical protein
MSTLNVSNISDGTDTVATGYVVNGSAKAWSEFTTSVAINDSFNVASMSDNNVGEYQTNLTNSMASTAYTALGDVENFNAFLTTTGKTASSWINYTSRDDSGGLADVSDMQNVAHGDLA